MKVLVTGATGFVGRALCAELLRQGHQVRAAVRRHGAPLPATVESVAVGELSAQTDWLEALAGIEVVLHLAARVHVMRDSSTDPLAEYRRVNVEGTRHLAAQAAAAGVRRLVFVSSVKVNGEESPRPYREVDPPRPLDPYGVSKLEAEEALRRIERDKALEVVVVRPPLVYGPGVKANFLALLKLARLGAPLPLGSVDNGRSLVYVKNLAHALCLCATHPAAAGETFLVSDGPPVSTTQLVRLCAEALGRPARVFPFPVALLKAGASLAGAGGVVSRLTGSLAVDGGKIRRTLGWRPPFTFEQGVRETAAWFEEERRACR